MSRSHLNSSKACEENVEKNNLTGVTALLVEDKKQSREAENVEHLSKPLDEKN